MAFYGTSIDLIGLVRLEGFKGPNNTTRRNARKRQVRRPSISLVCLEFDAWLSRIRSCWVGFVFGRYQYYSQYQGCIPINSHPTGINTNPDNGVEPRLQFDNAKIASLSYNFIRGWIFINTSQQRNTHDGRTPSRFCYISDTSLIFAVTMLVQILYYSTTTLAIVQSRVELLE
jgi:hypothetical protein